MQRPRPKKPRYRPKKRLATRINHALADWLVSIAEREGWTVTDATEWALSGVRHLEHRLGSRMEALLEEERAGGDSVFAEFARRLESTFTEPAPAMAEPIVPPHRRTPEPEEPEGPTG